MDENGVVCSTVTNVSADESVEISCQIADFSVKEISAEILCGEINAKNDFENENNVICKEFTDFTKTADGFTAVIPPCSVVKFSIK